ncbi:lasso peptide biosynthesis B2 protein [Spirosoma sp. KNUC1025]|uniref:lasso peptide biosynthesis B2 protein n=1 Tax=Spirosoma sp. KNUC1025 TaxID=2894082 RepID=UPI0038694940|nr:lasso peptide biosynthesis B2 protein [Spirosoma sp. KNUC1025]
MKNWLRRIEKFGSYSFGQKKDVLLAFWVVLLVRIGLKMLSFQRFRQVYTYFLQPASVVDVSDLLIGRYVWAIGRVSGSLSAVCLPQALALKYLLRRDRLAEIVIGVDKNNGFSAHAWVEKKVGF